MKYCIDRGHIDILLQCVISGNYSVDDNAELNAILEGSLSWTDEIILIMYFTTKIFEQKMKLGINVEPLLREMETLPDNFFVSYQYFDSKFIEYMMSQVRTSGTTLEEELIHLQSRLNRYEYF